MRSIRNFYLKSWVQICRVFIFVAMLSCAYAEDSKMAADRNETVLTTRSLQENSVTESTVSSSNGTVESHHSPTPIPITESVEPVNATSTETSPDYIGLCPSNVACDRLGGDCIHCDFNTSCHYGRNVSVVCHAKPLVNCTGSRDFTHWMTCRYCYQTPSVVHRCSTSTGCRVAAAPRQHYEANCTVRDDVLCLGRRRFYKMLPCNWTSGKRWSTALILSITLGGFGADRFYLGLWREGIGKLFSFGGLGVWTLVDVVLVATGYIGPADGSLYIV